MIQLVINDFQENKICIQDVVISTLIDEFCELYSNDKMSPNEQIEYLSFINTLFRAKHKFLMDYNKQKRTFSRDMQMYHLKKIQRIAKMRIKQITPASPHKKYEASEEVISFKGIIRALNKKMKQDITKKTKMLLEELMKERWTIQEKSTLLKEILSSKNAKFQDLLESQESEEIITSFLALLDLKRKNEVIVIQKQNFGEIIITKGKEMNNV